MKAPLFFLLRCVVFYYGLVVVGNTGGSGFGCCDFFGSHKVYGKFPCVCCYGPDDCAGSPLCLPICLRWWQLKYILFSPRSLGKWSNLTIYMIFFRWVENSNYSLFFFLLHKDVYLLRACDFFKNRLVRVLHSFFNFCHIALARRCAWRDFHLGSGIDFYLKRVFEILRMLWSRWLFFFVDWFWNQRFRDVFGVSQINQRRVFPRRSVTIMGI